MNRSSKLSSLLALTLIVFAVLACNRGSSKNPIPEDKRDYVGDWRGQFQNETMTLSITSDGTVNYERKNTSKGTIERTNSKSISNGKISKFEGNDFVVKVLLVSTTFKVEKPPYRTGARWKMVVDGVEVSRKDESSTEVSINVAEMRKDDGTGKISDEATDTFPQTDKVMHTYVSLDNPKAGTKIKFAVLVVDAGAAKNQLITESTVTTADDAEDEARNRLRIHKPFPKGDYKVDIYVNDKLERTLHFKII